MKNLIFILLLLLQIFGAGESYINDKFNIGSFKAIPDSILDKKLIELINAIKPIKCKYWQCVYVATVLHVGKKGDVVVYHGDSVKYKKVADKYSSSNYFLSGCHPGYCGYYIVAVMNSKTTKVYDNENISEFIGTIDNLEEMILSTNIHGYRFSNETIVRGAYLELDTVYNMYVSELGYAPCYCSTKAILTKAGKFEIIEKTVLSSSENDSIIDMP